MLLSIKESEQKRPITRFNLPSKEKLSFVCISDTHNHHESLRKDIPAGDILLVAGDLSNVGDYYAINQFNDFLASLPHSLKIVISGNHDLLFDPNRSEELARQYKKSKRSFNQLKQLNMSIRDLLTNCVLLDDSIQTEVKKREPRFAILNNIHVYGSSWVPDLQEWAYYADSITIKQKWMMIPTECDILLTHTPPRGVLDRLHDGRQVGCPSLMERVNQIKPSYHVFGHVHESHGILRKDKSVFINASMCDEHNQPAHKAIVFEFNITNVKSALTEKMTSNDKQ
ncbi:hypothetical protein ACOME3_003924 [Neoechinorhynchus agilis]